MDAKQLREQLKKREKAKQAVENKNNFSGDFKNPFDDLEFVGISKEQPAIIRPLGNFFAEGREKPTDAKFLMWTKVLTEKKSYTHIYWKLAQNAEGKDLMDLDRQWWFYRFIKKGVFTYDWNANYEWEDNEGKKRTGKKEYHHKDMPLFQRLKANKTEDSNELYPHNVEVPKKKVVMNVIDRNDTWCVDNEHSKVLTSYHTFWQNDNRTGKPIYFTDPGIPYMAYELMIDLVAEALSIDEKDYDFILDKKGKGYEIKTAFDAIAKKKYSDAVHGELTDKEKGYGLFELDSVFGHSNYGKLYSKFFKDAVDLDKATGSKFAEELEELKAEEDKQQAKNKKQESKYSEPANKPDFAEEMASEKLGNIDDVEDDDENNQFEVEEKTEKKSRRKRSKKVAAKTDEDESVTLEDQCQANFPEWSEIGSENQKEVLKHLVRFDDTVPVWKDNSDVVECDESDCTYIDSEKQSYWPVDVIQCPICATEFE